jgi:group I intron endonuclease
MFIYKIISTSSKKVYVGKTSKNINIRFNEHKKAAYNENIKDTHLHKAIKKYGIEDFKIELLEICENKEILANREKFWIEYYKSLNYGYNMTAGGDGACGYKQTDEHKNKIADANRGQKRTEEQRKNQSDAHIGQVAWNKGISTDVAHLQSSIMCPFCNKEGPIGAMKKWHFDYCKQNPDKITRPKESHPGKSDSMSKQMKGKITVLDLRDNIRKNIDLDDFKKYDYYISNTSGIKYQKSECPHCNKEVAPQGKRWHFDNCKNLTEKL